MNLKYLLHTVDSVKQRVPTQHLSSGSGSGSGQEGRVYTHQQY